MWYNNLSLSFLSFIDMTEKAGRIEYEFGVQMDGVLKAESATVKSTDNMAKSFDKVDKSVKNFNTQTTMAARSVNKAFGNNLGQAGIQVQQFVGQLQGGQSAMVALAQQSADLGIVLGAPLIGVFVSLAAVAAGTLAPAIFDTKTSVEQLEKAIENTKAIMSVGAGGVIEYTDEIKKLQSASENLAKIKIALAITENNKALEKSKKEFISVRSELFGFQESAEDAAKRLTGMTDKTGDILGLASSLQAFNNAITDESKLKQLTAIEDTLLKLRNEKGQFPTGALTDFAQKFFTLSDATRQAITSTQALKSANENLDTSASSTGESFKKLRVSLKEQTIALRDGERSAFKYSLLMSGEYTAAQIQAALKIYDTNAALIEQKNATEKASKALDDEIDGYIKLGEEVTKTEERKAAAAQLEQDRLAQRGTTVGLTQVQTVETKYESDLEALKAAREQQLITNQEYDEREIELQRQKTEQINQINKDGLGVLGDAFANFEQQSAAALTSVVTGAQTGSEAMKGLARTILTSVIQAFIQKGIAEATAAATGASATTASEATKTAAITSGIGAQSAAAIAATSATTAAGVASGAAIATAMAPAAAASSVATAGAAPAAAAPIALSTIGAIIAALAGGMALAGGRQYGGPVSSGMYRVNETGVPEIYSQGGKDYLMNTKNANIKPLDTGASSGSMQVVVNNNTPYEVFVTQDQAANIANIQIGKDAALAAKGRGQMIKGIKAGTNAKQRARS